MVYAVLQVYKNSLFMKEVYDQQRNEKSKQELEREKQHMKRQLLLVRDYASIALYAQDTLHMCPISLSQIKRLPVSRLSVYLVAFVTIPVVSLLVII